MFYLRSSVLLFTSFTQYTKSATDLRDDLHVAYVLRYDPTWVYFSYNWHLYEAFLYLCVFTESPLLLLLALSSYFVTSFL